MLHLDRNNYYGGESASLGLNNLFEKFGKDPKGMAALGALRDWNVDLVPKFIMACGKLVKILLHTKVTRYLDFKSVDGSYVFKDGKIQKVPATPAEALTSALMGFFEKRKFRNFLIWLYDYDKDKPSTYLKGMSLDRITTRKMFEDNNLDVNTQSFIGHAMALHTDDSYLDEPASATAEAVQLYAYSLERYEKSPYIYPIYGLGGLPEGFSRLCAIHGGTFMLNKGIDSILFDAEGKAWGVQAGNEVAKAPIIVGDPSYFTASAKTRKTVRVVRSICILDHPIKDTDNAESVQIIIPAAQVKRKNDIYVCMVSNAHGVASAGRYIAIASTTVETAASDADAVRELQPGVALLGSILERFDLVYELYEPLEDGRNDGCFISKSYDATSHFETAAIDVLSMYRRITGKELDMSISADALGEDDE